MKRLLLYSVCLLMVAATGCNNDDKDSGKEKISDTTKLTAFTDPVASNGQKTIDQKTIASPQLENTTKKVAYIYDDFMQAITSWNTATGKTATEIYMLYAAYTLKDMTHYLDLHRGVTEQIFKDSILGQPCLLMGYPDPANPGKLFYAEFGTICPPPTSCETFALIKNRMQFFDKKEFVYPGFDPDEMIDVYNKSYNTEASRPLTSMVRFNIDSIRNLYKAAGTRKNESIYFFMGAYDNQDAQRYVKSHPGFNIAIGEIQDKTCLLFALFDPMSTGSDKYNYFDFGTICPPENSCKSTFK